MLDRCSLVGCDVLLCEDSADIQFLVTTVLKAAGASVTIAPNGESGVKQILLAAAGGKPFDVVIMDINMPILDGLDATRLVRAKGYRGPIVAFTALGSAVDRHKCLEAGCDEHLPKPLERDRLVSIVARFARPREAGVPHASACGVRHGGRSTIGKIGDHEDSLKEAFGHG